MSYIMSVITLARDLAAPKTANRMIFRAAVLVATFSLVAKLAGTAREIAVAGWFGRGPEVDALFIAFLVPTFVVNLVAGSVNSAVIPVFVQAREREGKEAAEQLLANITVCSVALLSGLGLLLGMVAPYYLPLLGSGFSVGKVLLTRHLMYVFLPFIVLGGLNVMWISVLNAGESFAIPALLPALSPLGGILCLFIAGRWCGIYALAVGLVLGQGIETVVLARMVRNSGLRLSFIWHGLEGATRQVASQYFPALAGAVMMTSTVVVDQAMAAMLAGGSVAALNYATKIVSVVLTVSSGPLSTALLPYFSRMAAAEEWGACRHTLETYARFVLLITIAIATAMVIFSRPLVKILFEHGRFSAADTAAVSRVEAFLALQIPFYAMAVLGVRLLNVLRKNHYIMVITAVNAVLNLVLNYVLMKLMGVAGIALSTSIVYALSCGMVFVCVLLSLPKAKVLAMA
ncbi:MAG TPA: lipid II flippase MurJ [Terriglobia bacterium]|nr:lipid II flippase MurJ [Terriglobia bacterium]